MNLVTDLALSRRLERAEARANVAFVEARARCAPEVGAAWREIGGAFAMFDGVGSPCTQTFALGLAGPPSDDVLTALEAFFAERGSEVFHEVSPLAGVDVHAALAGRGYRPVELTSVMCQPLAAGSATEAEGDGARSVRTTGRDEARLWAATAAAGWSTEGAHLGAFMEAFGEVSASSEGTVGFLAERDGEAVAAAALAIHDGVALLAGASTRPEWRGRGVQAALLRARLRHAAASGCDLAMVCAAPGSASQRNAERAGFRIAYTRIKWGRAAAGDG